MSRVEYDRKLYELKCLKQGRIPRKYKSFDIDEEISKLKNGLILDKPIDKPVDKQVEKAIGYGVDRKPLTFKEKPLLNKLIDMKPMPEYTSIDLKPMPEYTSIRQRYINKLKGK